MCLLSRTFTLHSFNVVIRILCTTYSNLQMSTFAYMSACTREYDFGATIKIVILIVACETVRWKKFKSTFPCSFGGIDYKRTPTTHIFEKWAENTAVITINQTAFALRFSSQSIHFKNSWKTIVFLWIRFVFVHFFSLSPLSIRSNFTRLETAKCCAVFFL